MNDLQVVCIHVYSIINSVYPCEKKVISSGGFLLLKWCLEGRIMLNNNECMCKAQMYIKYIYSNMCVCQLQQQYWCYKVVTTKRTRWSQPSLFIFYPPSCLMVSYRSLRWHTHTLQKIWHSKQKTHLCWILVIINRLWRSIRPALFFLCKQCWFWNYRSSSAGIDHL